jgi:DNA ligase (NAD+)
MNHENNTIKNKNKIRCKKGTKKYRLLGPGCYTKEEIENVKHKLSQISKAKKMKRTKKVKQNIDEEIIQEKIEPEIKKKNKSNKRSLKIPIELEIMDNSSENKQKRYNEEFIELMEKLNNIMLKQGEPFRARAYQKAQETIMSYPENIYTTSQLQGKPGIGSTIMDKLDEYVKTGTLRILEKEKTNPINILGDIYGVGPKKSKELVDAGITTIDELRARQDELLNDVQKVGLKYYEQIQKRIPRSEIEEYEKMFRENFDKVIHGLTDAKFEIVGSYRRGATESGDIDVIITGATGAVYKAFIDQLLKEGIILEVLSRGSSKTLVIAKLKVPGHVARRVDFLYAPPDEFAFAILYFTGSKIFNTVMRQYSLDKGYTFNEHGIYKLENKKKGEKVDKSFVTEKDIFDFLGLQFKTPIERRDGRSVIDVGVTSPASKEVIPTPLIAPVKKNTTLKKKKPYVELEIVDDIKSTEIKDNNLEVLQTIDNFKHNGISVLEQLNEKQLNDIIRASNSKYYNDAPVMTDNQYDIVKEFIEKKYPNNAVIGEIGADVERNKVKLPYEMASMDKIKPDTGILTTWAMKFKGPYVLSCKLDGVSGLYTTEGDKPKLYTRGNGKVGQDVSHLIPFLRLPKTKGVVIRGEFIILKDVFLKKYQSTFANPRNMVAGIINHKHISDTIVDLHFVAYEVIVPQKKPSEQMEFLGTIDVERVLYQVTNTLSNEMLSATLIDWRKSNIYEIDGVIVTNDAIYPRKSGNPDHAFAFKMVLSDQIAEAKVVDVIWTPSKDGYLKPRVKIEPIHLGGVTIEFATGFNGAFIKDNKIGIGAIIELIRSGDVIPYIKEVTVPAEEAKMPSVPFKWNDTYVDVMLENIADDPTVKEKNITMFFRGIGVEGLSSGNISRLIKAGFSTVPEIIHMSEQDFLTVDGFKGKLSNKIYTGIKEKLKEASIIELMAASNIFGRGFSEKKMEIVITELPDILISDESDDEKISAVASVKGMANKSAEALVYKIADFKEFLSECNLEDKLYETAVKKNVDKSHPLFDKSIVLTGTRDNAVIDFLKNVGAKQSSSVSKNTFLVIAKNKDEDTGKAEEARKINVPIMSVEEFIQTYSVN